ncbi:hypothetical protein LPYR103PRE_02490 [Segatella asaccharophila]|jgi:hypothetical protein|nr:hypothetical protein [Prevotella sp. UBA5379]
MRNYIKIDQGKVSIKVSVFIFKDGKSWVVYCPSLDLSGYDITEEGAKKDFDWILQDWLNTQTSNKTLDEDLKKHGWTADQSKWSEPDFKELLEKDHLMDSVMEKSHFVKTSIEVEAYC